MKKSTDKLKDFPIPKLRNNSRMSTFTTSSSHCTGGSNQGNQSSERNKRHAGCKEIKFPLFADDINEMILFIENANKHTHTHTQFSTDGEFSKVTEYKNLIHE